MMVLASAYTKFLGAVFAVIAAIMLINPASNLAQDGVMFDSFPVGGKAEVRAYYVGTGTYVLSVVGHCCHFYAHPWPIYSSLHEPVSQTRT